MDKIGAYVRNLKRKKLRTALAVIGIAIGVFSVVTVISIGVTGKEVIFSEIDNLGFSGLSIESEEYPLTEAQLSQVRSVTDGATPIIIRYAYSRLRSTDLNTVLIGAGGNVCSVTKLNVLYGRAFTEKEVREGARVCVLSADAAEQVYGRGNVCGKQLVLHIGGREIPLKIVGVAEAGTGTIATLTGQEFPAFAHMPYTTLSSVAGVSGFDRISVDVEPERAEAVAASVLKKLNSAAGDNDAYSVTDIDRERAKYSRIIDAVTAVVSGIGGISLLVAGLMIMTLMLVSVSERGREIGIKKALGARTSHIVAEFLTESAVISALGGAAGVALTFAAALALKLVAGVALTVSAEVVLAGLLLSCGTGVVFGVYPALKAARLRPAETLRR